MKATGTRRSGDDLVAVVVVATEMMTQRRLRTKFLRSKRRSLDPKPRRAGNADHVGRIPKRVHALNGSQ